MSLQILCNGCAMHVPLQADVYQESDDIGCLQIFVPFLLTLWPPQ